jgi:pilus assembly protein Flp/PilA
MTALIQRFRRDESGATAIEYGLLVALMGAALIICLTAFGPEMRGAFTRIGGQMATPPDVTSN